MGQSGPLSDIPANFFVRTLGSTAAIASGGANAVLGPTFFVSPVAAKVLSAFKIATANEATAGTATSSASYRRFNLLNGGTAGTGTTIMASLNNTVSTAGNGSKAFATTASNTMAAGEIGVISQLTVGAATAGGTEVAESVFEIWFQLL